MNPSQIFTNQSGELFKDYASNSIAEKAYERFRDKTFLEENKTKYVAFNIGSYAFQLLSALFAATFMYLKVCEPILPSFFPEAAKIGIAGFLTAFFLLVIEWIKRISIMPFVESVVKAKAVKSNHRIKWEMLLVNMPLMALSVFTSAEGAKLFSQQQTDNSKEIKANFSIQKDSINNVYQPQLTAVQENINALNKTLTTRKWGLTKDEMNVLNQQQEQLKTIQAAQKEALTALTQAQETELNTDTSQTAETSKYVLFASLICELLGIAGIGYVSYFLGNVYVERFFALQNQDQEAQKKSSSTTPTAAAPTAPILPTAPNVGVRSVSEILATAGQTLNIVPLSADTSTTTTNGTTNLTTNLTSIPTTNQTTNRAIIPAMKRAINRAIRGTPP